jgi:hypothetical protein
MASQPAEMHPELQAKLEELDQELEVRRQRSRGVASVCAAAVSCDPRPPDLRTCTRASADHRARHLGRRYHPERVSISRA